MNSSMGLSNMTALPSLVGAVDPRLNKDSFANRGPEGWGGEDPRPAGWWTDFKEGVGDFINYASGGAGSTSQILKEGIEYVEDEMEEAALAKRNEDELAHKLAANEAPAEKAIVEDEEGKPTAESLIYENYDDILANPAGFSPEKMAEMESKLDEKYARELQFALSGIDRQMAMMGTFGSGAHSFSINNATAQALGAMADEYAQLEKANALQYEKEYQETIQNKNILSDKLSNLEGLEGNKNKEAIILKGTLETETGIAQYISNELKALAPKGHHVFTGFFNDLSGDLFDKLTNGEITEDEVIGEYHARAEALMDALTAYAARSPSAQSKFDYFFAVSGVDGNNFKVIY